MNLTTLFGNTINVGWQPRTPDRQLNRYAGGFGATSMLMGSGTWPLTVRGTLRAPGASYAIARTAMVNLIKSIENLAWQPEQTYSYGNEIYRYVVFEKMILHDSDGKHFRWNGAYCLVTFTATFRSLL